MFTDTDSSTGVFNVGEEGVLFEEGALIRDKFIQYFLSRGGGLKVGEGVLLHVLLYITL